MTPEFAKAIDPIFLYVLGLLERIQRGENPPPQEERLRMRAQLDRAEATLGRSPEWELAKYALVAWIDEVLLDAPWSGHDWWENNALEVALFNTRLRQEQFYAKAQQAGQSARRDALEVFYLCVVLGFRGLYRDPSRVGMTVQARGLPPELEAWARQTAAAIRLRQGRPTLVDAGASGGGAPPLRGQSLLIWSSLAGVVLAAFALLVALLAFSG